MECSKVQVFNIILVFFVQLDVLYIPSVYTDIRYF